MRFQDLLDDLAEPRWEHHTITTVARRVAALYETCPLCGWHVEGPMAGCPRCGGTGTVASKIGEETQTTAGLKHLADYLFREER